MLNLHNFITCHRLPSAEFTQSVQAQEKSQPYGSGSIQMPGPPPGSAEAEPAPFAPSTAQRTSERWRRELLTDGHGSLLRADGGELSNQCV